MEWTVTKGFFYSPLSLARFVHRRVSMMGMIGHSGRTFVLRMLLGGLSASSPAFTPEIPDSEKKAATRQGQSSIQQIPSTSDLHRGSLNLSED